MLQVADSKRIVKHSASKDDVQGLPGYGTDARRGAGWTTLRDRVPYTDLLGPMFYIIGWLHIILGPIFYDIVDVTYYFWYHSMFFHILYLGILVLFW